VTTTVIIPTIVLLISVAACVTDLSTRRIPNLLTFSAALAGLAFQIWSNGLSGALLAGGGWLTGLAMFLPFFALGGMGGGDVKLLAALGAWLGPYETISLALYSAAAGGALALVVALGRGYLRTALANIVAMLRFWQMSGFRPVPDLTLDTPTAPRLAYAVPMLVGTVATLWL
jgi:prepilin peptidase CpaA